eukprot:gene32048-16582_t
MSDSDSREENPIDTLILKKAAKRKASRPADDDDSDVEAAPLTEEASVIIEIPSSSVEDVSVSVVEEKANKRTPKKKKKQKTNATDGPGKKNPSAARSPAAKKSSINVKQLAAGIPFGVLLVDKGVITRDAEVSKLLRVPRYFDEALEQEEQTSRRCFNCGMVGHAIRDCTNAARKKPCHLCARLGHDGQDCPNRKLRERPGQKKEASASGVVKVVICPGTVALDDQMLRQLPPHVYDVALLAATLPARGTGGDMRAHAQASTQSGIFDLASAMPVHIHLLLYLSISLCTSNAACCILRISLL